MGVRADGEKQFFQIGGDNFREGGGIIGQLGQGGGGINGGQGGW